MTGRDLPLPPEQDTLVWECGPHTNAWNGHDARCRQVPREDAPSPDYDTPTMRDLLAELQAIRGLLERQDAEQAVCPHGSRGLCMSCVTPQVEYALSELVRAVSNSAGQAVRRVW